MAIDTTNGTAMAVRDEQRGITQADPEQAAAALNHILATGDLSKLSNEQRRAFYLQRCASLGLNSLSRPFDWLMLDGKLVLYENKSCAEQLRRQHQISIRVTRSEVIGAETKEPMYVVAVEGRRPNGQTDEATKYVPLSDSRGRLTGKNLANAYAKAECVPLDSEILTRDGWKTYDRLTIGEEVLAYDVEGDLCRWTPLQAVTTYDEALTARFGTDIRTGFRCTLDHSWVVQHPRYRPDRRGGGSRGPRGAYANRRPERELMEAQRITSGADRVILAAPSESGSHPLTAHEAAILGWVMTDGSIRRRGTFVQLSIRQSKTEHVEQIQQLVAASGYRASHSVGEAGVRDFGTHVSSTLAQHRWYISAHDSRALLAKAGIESPADMPRLVTQLSTEARAAMLGAMMAADGDTRGRFGKKRKPGVMVAWEILATLEGHALGSLSGEDRAVRVRKLRSQRTMGGGNMTLTEGAAEAVWCPTTAYGTWVMRQGDQIAITGNSGAKRRLTFSMVGMAAPPDPDEMRGAQPIVVDGTGRIIENPTQEQKALAADPNMARVIGEPRYEDGDAAHSPLVATASQAARIEEIDAPKQPRRQVSLRCDANKWRGAYFGAVEDTHLETAEGRREFLAQYTADYTPALRTDSLSVFLKVATERQAEEMVITARSAAEQMRGGSISDAADEVEEEEPDEDAQYQADLEAELERDRLAQQTVAF